MLVEDIHVSVSWLLHNRGYHNQLGLCVVALVIPHHEIDVLIYCYAQSSQDPEMLVLSRSDGGGLLSGRSDKPGVWHHRQLFSTVKTPSSDNIVHLKALETL